MGGQGTLTGMIPILHSPGLMIPGQLGPIRRVLDCSLRTFFTRTMSCCGMPSVMHTTKSARVHTAQGYERLLNYNSLEQPQMHRTSNHADQHLLC